MVVVGYFNTELVVPEGNTHTEGITAYVVASGMEEISLHSLLCCKSWEWDGMMCSMHRGGGEGVRSWAGYLLGM